VTAGQVLHQNLNLAEIHTTANVLTMHVDLTPLNVHIAQKVLAFDVHITPSAKHGHWNVGGGGHHTLVGEIHQEAQDVRITSTQRELGFADKRADVSHAPARKGNMTLKADEVMSLSSTREMRLLSGPDGNPGALLELNGRDSEACLSSNRQTTVRSVTRTLVTGGKGTGILLETGSLKLSARGASVTLGGDKLTMNATSGTRINGKVSLGERGIVEAVDGRDRRAEDLRAAAALAAAAQQAQQAQQAALQQQVASVPRGRATSF